MSELDSVELLVLALHQTYQLVDGVTDDQLDDSTPCATWKVRDLLDHLLEDLEYFSRAANGGDESKAQTFDRGDNWASQFRKGSDVLIEGWRQAGDLSGTIEVPGMGEVPKSFPVNQQIAEFAQHSWDLAIATGQAVDLDQTVAEQGLRTVQTMLQPQYRGSEAEGKVFGPEVDIRTDAPATERLAAFLGRTPRT